MSRWIDETAGHPDDPMLPADALGASDKVLAAADPGEIADLLRQSKDWINTPAARPRHLFALGRAAVAHGYDRMGSAFLQRAVDAGSIAAVAYQGYAAFDAGRKNVAKAKLDQAKKAGFKSQALDDAIAALDKPAEQGASPAGTDDGQPATNRDPYKASDFGQPELIQALYDGNFERLNRDKLSALIYISHLNDAAIDKSLYLSINMHVQREFDKTLNTRVQLSVMGSSDLMTKGAGMQMQTMGGVLQALMKVSKNGGNPMDSVAAVGQASANSPMMKFQILMDQAEQDGVILATLYETDRDAFRKINASMKKYVYSQTSK